MLLSILRRLGHLLVDVSSPVVLVMYVSGDVFQILHVGAVRI